ncbi:MAG: hypothetical protein COB50_03525 [Thiotrichales bacterium]|nr:MAG: hypothetical protein COB50_03525 [Thiotrichales bacterium]
MFATTNDQKAKYFSVLKKFKRGKLLNQYGEIVTDERIAVTIAIHKAKMGGKITKPRKPKTEL